MELVDEQTHLGLLYLARLTAGGIYPTPREFNAFLEDPQRKRRSQGGSLQAVITHDFGEFSRNLFGRVEVEACSEYFIRVGWAIVSGGKLVPTDLGRGLAKSLEMVDEAADATSVTVTLSDEDPVAYARVFDILSSLDDVIVVDPYLDFDGYADLAKVAGVQRVLTRALADNASAKAQNARLALALAASGTSHAMPELRAAKNLHDRYFVPAAGPIWMLGTSLNGVGNKFSVMVPLPEVGAEQVRAGVEEAWKIADPVTPAASAGDGDAN